MVGSFYYTDFKIIFWCGYCKSFYFHDKENKAVLTDGRVSKYMCDECYTKGHEDDIKAWVHNG